jgi:hypothetical protein
LVAAHLRSLRPPVARVSPCSIGGRHGCSPTGHRPRRGTAGAYAGKPRACPPADYR